MRDMYKIIRFCCRDEIGNEAVGGSGEREEEETRGGENSTEGTLSGKQVHEQLLCFKTTLQVTYEKEKKLGNK